MADLYRSTREALAAATPEDESERLGAGYLDDHCATGLALIESGERSCLLNEVLGPQAAVRQLFDLLEHGSPAAWERIGARLGKVPAAIDGYRQNLAAGLAARSPLDRPARRGCRRPMRHVGGQRRRRVVRRVRRRRRRSGAGRPCPRRGRRLRRAGDVAAAVVCAGRLDRGRRRSRALPGVGRRHAGRRPRPRRELRVGLRRTRPARGRQGHRVRSDPARRRFRRRARSAAHRPGPRGPRRRRLPGVAPGPRRRGDRGSLGLAVRHPRCAASLRRRDPTGGHGRGAVLHAPQRGPGRAGPRVVPDPWQGVVPDVGRRDHGVPRGRPGPPPPVRLQLHGLAHPRPPPRVPERSR